VSAVADGGTLLKPTAACVLGSLVAGAMIGLAATISGTFDLRYVLGATVVAIPIGLVLAGLALVRPSVALLALVELLAFAAVVLAEAVVGTPSDPLGIAVVAAVTLGALAVAGWRARPGDLFVALLLGWLTAALIYELGIPLHSVF
jgi:hypothetical protein